MKGQIATPALMRAVLDPATGLRTGRVICQVVLLEVRPSGRLLLLADTGICIQPSLEQKADILRQAVAVANRLGADEARVAVMAATESVSEAANSVQVPDDFRFSILNVGGQGYPIAGATWILAYTCGMPKDKADALEAELEPLVGGPIVARMFRYDTDPAHNPQPPPRQARG